MEYYTSKFTEKVFYEWFRKEKKFNLVFMITILLIGNIQYKHYCS
jgi:hypothetical protein